LAGESHPVPPPPSWPHVIATTMRLWVERHVVPPRPSTSAASRPTRSYSGGNGSARSLPYRLVGGFVGIAVVAGAVTAFAIARVNAAPSPAHASRSADPVTSAQSSALNSQALTDAAAVRQQTATWVAAQVSRGEIIGCDPLMCAALQQHGLPSADLATLGASTGDPLGSGIVISTTAVRSQLGPRLASVYAPLVIASFGAGASLVQVRVVTPGGMTAYGPAERTDLAARQVAGRELARNSNIQEPAAAKAALQSGRVDSRLMMTLSALAATSRIQVTAFSDAGPGVGTSVPLRQVTVVTSSTTNLRQLLSFLNAQRPPLLANVSQHRDGRMTTVQIQFTAPSPTGLLPTSSTLALAAGSS
jgi:hypothetical protein